MATNKSKGRKWDGKSRVSNDLYRKNYDNIFKNTKLRGNETFDELLEIEEEQKYLEELKNKL
jgi:hypothetical protein|tara:strand:+ start:144 stop:329 length:186 start_codon:yes stop_codon:yes gene_type:complete